MSTVIGIFHNRDEAQQAINELIAIGFDENQIGVVARDGEVVAEPHAHEATEHAVQGAAAGAAVGLGAGALWGLGIVAGILPALGPIIVGGTISAMLASAATGAAAGGIAGALTNLGISHEHVDYYETAFKEGRVIVSVTTERVSEAQQIFRKFGAYEHEQVH